MGDHGLVEVEEAVQGLSKTLEKTIIKEMELEGARVRITFTSEKAKILVEAFGLGDSDQTFIKTYELTIKEKK